MSISARLTEVFETSDEVPFDDSSKFIFFSDCHRGDNSWADDFAHNQTLFFYALSDYYRKGFTYIELGDGDELWENRRFSEIRKAHSHVFWLMREFHKDGRLYLIWGNHDKERQSSIKVQHTLQTYYNDRDEEEKPLLDGIKAHEGLILRHTDTGSGIFLVHGHQGDLLSDRLWKLSRFLVRHLWRHFQLLGIRDPTSPAKNFKKRKKVEDGIKEWAGTVNQMVICGHTHRPLFPKSGTSLYFNTGSCVHPRCITGIEIENGKITLIKWWFAPNEDGLLCVKREILPQGGPERLQSFFNVMQGLC